jgi:hypothetical protein
MLLIILKPLYSKLRIILSELQLPNNIFWKISFSEYKCLFYDFRYF